MGGNSFGTRFRVSTFGESHGACVGCVIDGAPAGLRVDKSLIINALKRRQPVGISGSGRIEPDDPEILSGVFQGVATGAPIAVILRNRDCRSEDYQNLRDVFRPGHADYTWQEKFGTRDYRGGGRASGRETAARVIAGAIATELLKIHGIKVFGGVVALGGINAKKFDWSICEDNPLRCPDSAVVPEMLAAVASAREKGDSLGGVVECHATGLPTGLGEPIFDKLDALIAHAVMSIGAVKGIEFGAGFEATAMTGSQNNDELTPEGFASNHSGGVLGGISSGQELIFRAAIKPTPSISLPQKTIDTAGEARELSVTGRHDVCIAPRVVAVVEAMTAIVLADLILLRQNDKI